MSAYRLLIYPQSSRLVTKNWLAKWFYPALFILLNCDLTGAQILSNGGFESGLTGWNTSLSNGGSATFANSTSDIHSGTNALLITVANAGNTPTSVRLFSSPFSASSSDTYVLRFWASASVDFANLAVNLNGATPIYPQIPFEISTNDDSYQEYLYAFKASGNISIVFNFQTVGSFWLDDVEVLDLTNSDGWDIPMTYLWQWGQLNYSKTNSIGWGGADNDKSALLQDGSVAWIFNDTWTMTLTNTFYSNVHGDASLPRNSLVHQVGTNLYWMNNGTATFFVPKNPANLYWIGDSVVETNKLLVLLNEINATAITNVEMAVATLSLPGLTLDNLTEIPSAGTDNYGSFVNGGDGFYYIYDGPKVARVPLGSLAVSSAWTYWNGSGWVADHTQAVGLANLMNPWSTIQLGASNFVTVFMPPLSLTIEAQFAPTPMGPWSSPVPLFQTDGQWGELYYAANICAGTETNGVYTIGYSDNDSPDGLLKVVADKSYYNPHFIKANLLQLSPYTPPNGLNLALQKTVTISSIDNSDDLGPYAVDGNFSTRWSSAYSDPQWIVVDLGSTQTIAQVRLYWETASGKSYRIDVSDDASAWKTVYGTTSGSGGTEIVNFSPVAARYVRMYGTQRNTIWGYSLWEMQIYAPYESPGVSAPIAQPSTNVYEGMTVSLVCSNYTGLTPQNFQWEKSSDATNYSSVNGAATNLLILPSVTTNDSGYFQLVFTAAGQSVTSSVVQLNVNPPLQLSARPTGANLVLSWPYGTLLQAANVTGPWTTNNASSPYRYPPSQPQMFFRVQLQ
jgi:hypothetical protein